MRPRRVVNVETGEVFSSLKEAAASAGVTVGTVRQALMLGCRAGGSHWKDAPRSGASPTIEVDFDSNGGKG